VVNGTSATYTAMFDVLYQLTTASSPPAGGVVLPSSGAFYSAGSVFALQAFANPGYQFANFSGALSGSTNPQNITLNGPANVVANFTKQAPSLAASVGARSGEAAWRQVTLTLTNTGVVAATNVRITDITGIQVLTGNGLVSKISTFPMDVSPSIGKASSAVANAIFGWPETAQRVRFTVNFSGRWLRGVNDHHDFSMTPTYRTWTKDGKTEIQAERRRSCQPTYGRHLGRQVSAQ
jgi:hypothetical protein